MSRWREMLMDYGQVFNGSRASSEIYSVDGDLEERSSEDMELRRSLEVNFRPLFQRYVYGGEKLACHDLRRILRDPDYRDLLPPDKVSELTDVADFNRGKAMTYTEFVGIVMGNQLPEEDSFSFESTLSYQKDGATDFSKPKSDSKGVLPVICRNTANQEMVDEKVREYKCYPPAVFMITMTAAQIAVYFYYCSEDISNRLKPLEGVGSSNDVWYTPTKRREPWRFITYCILHDGYIDLAINVILQLALGVPLEIIYSWWRLMVVYALGVIAGSLGQSVTDYEHGLVGAAGGAYAVTFGHLICMWDNRKSLNSNEKESKGRRMMCSVTLRAVIILLLVAVQVGLGVYRRFFADNDPKIGIGAYVAGIVTGALMGRAFLKDPKRYPWQDGAGYLSIFLYLIFVGFAVIFNIVFVYYPTEDYS